MDSVRENVLAIEASFEVGWPGVSICRELLPGVQRNPALVLTPPHPTLGLQPLPPSMVLPAHCSGTKAVQIWEKEGGKIKSAELILLVSEWLALAPESGSHAGRVVAGALG